MRKPKYSDCTDDCGQFDQECYDTAMGDYEDTLRDEQIEQQWDKELEERNKYVEDRRIKDNGIGIKK